MALTIKSIYSLWALSSDLVFVILFPQLLCAVYVPFVNTYGSLSAYIVGLILRLGGGETVIGLPPFIKYPLFQDPAASEKFGKQLFPFRTLSMFVSFLTLILVSLLFKFLFEKEILPEKLDCFKAVVRKHETQEYGFQETFGTYKTTSETMPHPKEHAM